MRSGEEHAAHRLGGNTIRAGRGNRERLQNLEVQDGIFERDRDELLGLEPQGASHLVVRHRRQIDRPHEHPRGRDTHPDRRFFEAQFLPEPLDRRRDRGRVDDLAVAHGAGG